MFSSLKHPVRRKILRVLADKPTSFSLMLEELGVSSSHLTYHLESLGELVTKTDGGDYKLSTFGEAAVNTMRIVEDAPAVTNKQRWLPTLQWKAIFAALIIGVVLLASFSVIQYNAFNNLSGELNDLQAKYEELLAINPDTGKGIKFLRDVIELDLNKYEPTLLSNTVDNPSALGGLTEQIQHYQLVGSDSRLEVTFIFRNNVLSSYRCSVLEGSPIYSEAQPFTVLDSAKWVIQLLSSYENAPYLEQLNSTLYKFNNVEPVELTEGNTKFNMSVSGTNAEIEWFCSQNGVDFTDKGVRLVFDGQTLKELDDGYFLYEIGNTNVNINSDSAIQLARNAVTDFTWTSSKGQVYGFKVVDASAVFQPAGREDPLTLIPCWHVTLYLDNVYPDNVNRIAVEVWADTGKVGDKTPLSG